MKINFYPEWDNENLIKESEIFNNVWIDKGEIVIQTIESLSGLKFKENIINVIVFEGRLIAPISNPLCLRINDESIDTKLAQLIHELIHRLFKGNNIKINSDKSIFFESHILLDILLYEVLIVLFDKDFVSKFIEHEKSLSEDYREAWESVLSYEREERLKMFKEKIK